MFEPKETLESIQFSSIFPPQNTKIRLSHRRLKEFECLVQARVCGTAKWIVLLLNKAKWIVLLLVRYCVKMPASLGTHFTHLHIYSVYKTMQRQFC